jgi:hypothetical protein
MRTGAVLVLALLSGCATTTYAPSPHSDSSGTTAVFIRERAEPTAWNVSVLIDGEKMASIANRSSATFDVKPGKHSFKIDWPALAGQLDLIGDVEFSADEPSYFLITGNYEFTGMAYKAIQYNTTVALIRLSRAEGEQILSELPAR